ncbi:unnamed protein product, partial [Symbiodinium natans]
NGAVLLLTSRLTDPQQSKVAAAVLGDYFSTLSSPSSPTPGDHMLADSLANPADIFMQYVPGNLEVRVGQLVEMRPSSAAHLQGYRFSVAPRLPPGVTLDERSGLVYGKPEEATPEQVNYFVTAWNLDHSPMRMRQALIKLTINSESEAQRDL